VKAIGDYSDERLKSWCIHCGRTLGERATNRDHVPSRSLLLEPYPENLPLVQVCASCNVGFSLDEEYFVAFLGAVVTGSTDPAKQSHPVVSRVLERSPKLRAQIEAAKSEVRTLDGETRLLWMPDAKRVRRVVLKNARGHAFFEQGEPMLDEPSKVSFLPLETMTAWARAEFEAIDMGTLWPEVGSRMMTRLVAGHDLQDGWVVVQDGIYRYAVTNGGRVVRSVVFEYLATEVIWED